MKIIIIGSKGFIGRHIEDYFISVGHDVMGADVVVDYVNTGSYFLIDASNSDYSSVFEFTTFDLCVNCSGAASVADSMNNPMRDYYLNTLNVYRILEAIRKHQPSCRFINLSSAAVYGNPVRLPVSEDFIPSPISPYGIHKLQSEQICKEFYDFFRIRTCSLRIFSVYGAGLQKQLFWDLYLKVRAGIPFTLFGTGEESRDYIFISDLARAIELTSEFSSFRADIVNVANGIEVKIKESVSLFLDMFGTDVKYTFSGDSRKGDPVNWRADITKLESFNYKPTIDMKEGLQIYSEWLRSSQKS